MSTEDRCVACGSSLTISCDEAHQQHDTYHPDGHRRPEPEWADVREAARKAGYRLARRGRHHNDHVHAPMRKMTRWELDPVADGAEARGGFTLHYSWWFNDGDEGSSLAVEIDLDDGSGTELLVWDATPEQAMVAARLVGLGGDSDER